MTLTKQKQIKLLHQENSRLRMLLRVIKNQDECFIFGKHIDCKTLKGVTEEDKMFEIRLAENLCPHCIARLAFV